MTEARLSEKRQAHTLARREKRRHRDRLHGFHAQSSAWRLKNTTSWLAGLGMTHKESEKRQRLEHAAALESHMAKAAMSKDAPKGLISRIKSFFRGRGR